MDKKTGDKHRFLKLDKYVILFLTLIIFDLELFGIFGEIIPFRDYVNVFEGGYRVLFGQVQYSDFYFPTGPMVFLIQAFFQFILGSNLFAMAVQSFALAVILCTLFYYLIRKEFGLILSFIFALFFYLSFNGLTFQPWYDHVVYFFFFLNIFLLLKYYKQVSLPKSVYILSAVLATLSFYSKQDVGLLQVFFVLIFFIFNYSKDLKSAFKYYLFPVILMIGGIFLIFSLFTDITYWFNFGQYPHSSRFLHFFITIKAFNIITSWKLYVSLFLIYKILLNRIHKINTESTKLMCLFVIVAVTPLIAQITSRSHIQTLVTGIPILFFILFILIKENIKKITKQHKFIFGLIMTILLLLTITPFETYGQTTLSYFDPNLGRINQGCYSGALLPNASLEGLETIRKTIEENGNNFISFTEYQFLYCDYNIEPPKKFPLCFMEGVCFFNQDVPDLLKTIQSLSPNVILLQNQHNHYNSTLNTYIEDTFYDWGYDKTGSVSAITESKNISIFVKKNLNNASSVG